MAGRARIAGRFLMIATAVFGIFSAANLVRDKLLALKISNRRWVVDLPQLPHWQLAILLRLLEPGQVAGFVRLPFRGAGREVLISL